VNDDRKTEIDREKDEAKEKLKELEGDPPQRLEDWPGGRGKYETFGGPEHETSYDESATSQLGPSEVRHHEDGRVTVGGEEVEDPDEYKGEPIPGGPTDPSTPKVAGEQDLSEKEKETEKESDEE
jgi:hypothetical protein